MLKCDEGHKTEVYVRMTDGNGETLFTGIAGEGELQGILSALEEGSCPACAVIAAG